MIKFIKDLFKPKLKPDQLIKDIENKLFNPKIEIGLSNYIFANSKSIDPYINFTIKVIFDIKANNKPYSINDNICVDLNILTSKNFINYIKDSSRIKFDLVKLLNSILGPKYFPEQMDLLQERITKNILNSINNYILSEKWNKEIILIREEKLKQLIEFMKESGFTYKDIRNYQMLE